MTFPFLSVVHFLYVILYDVVATAIRIDILLLSNRFHTAMFVNVCTMHSFTIWTDGTENKTLERILGPKRDVVTGGGSKLHYEKFYLHSSPNIIRVWKWPSSGLLRPVVW
jgi:hypothetical protein